MEEREKHRSTINTNISQVESMIEEFCTPFGSRVYGGATKESDYDFLMDDRFTDSLLHHVSGAWLNYWLLPSMNGTELARKEVQEEDENKPRFYKMYNRANIKFELNGKMYNVVTYKTEDLEKVISIIKYMHGDSLLHEFIKENKVVRSEIFQGLLNVAFNPIREYFECNEINRIPIINIDDDDIPLGVFWDT